VRLPVLGLCAVWVVDLLPLVGAADCRPCVTRRAVAFVPLYCLWSRFAAGSGLDACGAYARLGEPIRVREVPLGRSRLSAGVGMVLRD